MVETNIEPADWVKGQAHIYKTDISIPEELHKGDYLLCVGIVDTTKGDIPGINLSLPVDKLIDDWAYISKVNI